MPEINPVLENEIRGQGVFVGTFMHSLDNKKRVTIPSEWRAQVGDPRSLYVLPDVYQRCLCVYSSTEMVRRLRNVRHHSIADRKAREFSRILASRSDLVSWDSQGRIRVKDDLLEFAQLKAQVTLVGAFDCFEMWNPDNLGDLGGSDPERIQEAARYVGF